MKSIPDMPQRRRSPFPRDPIFGIALLTVILALPALALMLLRADAIGTTALAAAVLICALVLTALVFRRLYRRAKIDRRLHALTTASPRFPAYTGDPYAYLFTLTDLFGQSVDHDANYLLLQKQAELGVMQNQINPHFLYNTLECLRGLAIMQGAEETADMAELLSRLYRYYISSGNDMQPIENELQCVDNYLKIQQYRFSNRFTLINNIDYADRSIMDYRIPKLTLQPIIENIIRHAFNTRPFDNRIVLEVEKTQSRLILRVVDNGDGMDEATLHALNARFTSPDTGTLDRETSGTGIALTNVNMRIRMVFGNAYGLTAFSSIGLGTEIRIELPCEEPLYE